MGVEMRTTKLSIVVRPALLAVAAVAVLAPSVALATDPVLWGWVTGRQPSTTDYTPAPKDQGNDDAQTNTVHRNNTGVYNNHYPQIENPNHGGTHIATALSSSPRYCVSGDIGRDDTTSSVSLEVLCYRLNGEAADTRYSDIYTTGGVDSGTLAFLWANEKVQTTPYTPDLFYQFNSSGPVANTVHRTSVGTYKVTLPGMSGTVGNIQISAAEDAYCRLQSWKLATPVVITVKCLSPVTNAAVDSTFDLAYTDGVGLTGAASGSAVYLFANKPRTASYTPDAKWRFSTFMKPTVKRTGTGAYTVVMPGMPAGGAAVVTPAGTGTSRCQLGSIATSTPQKVTVRCFSASGNPVDSKFTFSYVNVAN
jgi:hypothetical protein